MPFTVNGEPDGSVTIAGVENWNYGAEGTNVFESSPPHNVE
jgi:hypothetical protein